MAPRERQTSPPIETGLGKPAHLTGTGDHPFLSMPPRAPSPHHADSRTSPFSRQSNIDPVMTAPPGYLSRPLSPPPVRSPSRKQQTQTLGRSSPIDTLEGSSGEPPDVLSASSGKNRGRARRGEGSDDRNKGHRPKKKVRKGQNNDDEGEGDDEEDDEEDEEEDEEDELEGFDDPPSGPHVSGPSDADSERSGGRFMESKTGSSEGLLVPLGKSFRVQKKRTRVLPTAHQSAELNKLLAETPFPTTARREELGRKIGLSARKVQVWFQNQRQKARRQRTEHLATPMPSHLSGSSAPSSSRSLEHSAAHSSLVLQEVGPRSLHPEVPTSLPYNRIPLGRAPFIGSRVTSERLYQPFPGPETSAHSFTSGSHYSAPPHLHHHDLTQPVQERLILNLPTSAPPFAVSHHGSPISEVILPRLGGLTTRTGVQLPPIHTPGYLQSVDYPSVASPATSTEHVLSPPELHAHSPYFSIYDPLRRGSHASEPSFAADADLGEREGPPRRGSESVALSRGRIGTRSGRSRNDSPHSSSAYTPPFTIQPRPLWDAHLRGGPPANLALMHSQPPSVPMSASGAGPSSLTPAYHPHSQRSTYEQSPLRLGSPGRTRDSPLSEPLGRPLPSAGADSPGRAIRSQGATPPLRPREREPARMAHRAGGSRYDPVRDG